METVENKNISVTYRLYTIDNEDSEFVEEASIVRPFQFISGLGLVLEPFEKQIRDLPCQSKFDFIIPASLAYGEYDEEHILELPKETFFVNGKFDSENVVRDAIISLMNNEGRQMNGSVMRVKENTVVVDLNHPLAGCDLHFVGKVISTRPATPEEITETLRTASQECGDCSSCGGSCGGCGGGRR